MKKKLIHHHHKIHHRTVKKATAKGDYLVMVQGWMVVVAFAMMLGLGAIIGTFINQQINATTPQVAGYSTEFR